MAGSTQIANWFNWCGGLNHLDGFLRRCKKVAISVVQIVFISFGTV
jgi:hypothetical protein